MRYQRQFTVACPPQQAIGFVADLTNLPRWDHSVAVARQVHGSTAEVGAQFAVRVRFMGREIAMRYAIVALEPGRRVVLRGEAPGAHALDDIRAEPHGEGTRIVYTAQIDLDGRLWRWLDPLLGALFAPTVRRAVRGLQKCLDGRG